MRDQKAITAQCDEIIQALTMLKEDEGVPKNVRAKIDIIITDLKDETDISSKIGKSLHHLDGISEDMNLPPFIRTQIYSISIMLEKLNN